MRHVLFAVLVAVPSLLVGWVLGRGTRALPPEVAAPSASRPGPKVEPAAAPTEPKPVPAAPVSEDDALRALFDGPLGGLLVKEKVELYDEKKLFDYIDGAAPNYLDRKFRKLAATELATSDGHDLTCDIYDMRAPENVESIFQFERSSAGKPVEGFPDAVAGPMSLVFKAGRYYVKLTAFDTQSEAALPALAKAVRGKVR